MNTTPRTSEGPRRRLRPILFLPAVLLLLLGLGAYHLHGTMGSALHRHVMNLRSEARERDALARKVYAAEALELDPTELARRRAEHVELLRLRGQVGELRRQAAQNPAQAQLELETLQRETTEAAREADLWEARMKAEDTSRTVSETMQGGLVVVRNLMSRRDGLVPGSWEEVERLVGEPVTGEEPRRAMIRQVWQEFRQKPLGAVGIELVPVPGPLPVKDMTLLSRMLVLRERQARALPDGGWARLYAFLDGRLEEATSADGDFSAWELRMSRSAANDNDR